MTSSAFVVRRMERKLRDYDRAFLCEALKLRQWDGESRCRGGILAASGLLLLAAGNARRLAF
jgi:hypothetical protein